MKLYPNLIRAVVETLDDILIEGVYADKAIERKLKTNKKWGARDRHFIASTTYEIIRYKRLLLFLMPSRVKEEQLSQGLFKTWLWWKTNDLPDFPVLPLMSPDRLEAKLQEAEGKTEIKESVPDWLYKAIKADYPKEYDALLKALNTEADVVLRTNTLKTGKASLLKQLERDKVQAAIFDDSDALVLKRRTNVFRTKAFQRGLFEVQDRASQEVAPFLQVSPGMQVIDACAGAGGKTLHLSALMSAKGRIIAMDTEDYKLAELKIRARRAGAGNVETRQIENSKVVKRLHGKADRLLLDVPCTGSGVLRRNPDSKWKMTPDFLNDIKAIQADILNRYTKMVKPGGKLVYATCSVLSSENRQQVDRFINDHPEFELEEDRTLSPHTFGYDGFYMARLIRKA